MTRLYTRSIVLPLLMFTAVLLFIRAQPYDDSKLRRLLLPDECPTPCFMGIKPGVTTLHEVLELLKANAWVSKIDDDTINNQRGFIRWDWSDQKPNWITDKIKGKLWINEQVVETITIYSDLRLGDTTLVLGLPEGELVDPTQNRGGRSTLYMAFYNQKGLLLRIWQPCDVVEPFLQPVIFTYTVQTEVYNFPYRNKLSDVFHICSSEIQTQ